MSDLYKVWKFSISTREMLNGDIVIGRDFKANLMSISVLDVLPI